MQSTVKGPGRVTFTTTRAEHLVQSGDSSVGLARLSALAQFAVEEWFRIRSFSLARLRDQLGLELCVTDVSAVSKSPLPVNLDIRASTQPVGQRYFTVKLEAAATPTTATTLRVSVVMLRQKNAAVDLPPELEPLVVDTIAGLGTAVATHDTQFEARDLDTALLAGDLGWHLDSRVATTRSGTGQFLANHLMHAELMEKALRQYISDHGDPTVATSNPPRLTTPRFRVRLINESAAHDHFVVRVSTHQVLQGSHLDLRIDTHVQGTERSLPAATGIVLVAFEDTATSPPAAVPLRHEYMAALQPAQPPT